MVSLLTYSVPLLKKETMNFSISKSFPVAVSIPILFTVVLMILSPIFSALPSKLWYGAIGCLCAYGSFQIGKKLDSVQLKNFSIRFDRSVLPNFSKGLLLGLAVAIAMIGSQIWYSDLVMTFHQENIMSFFMVAITILPLALMEEMAFRSYAFVKLDKEYGIWTAQIIMAVLFALYHVPGNWSFANAFLGPGIWALAFGLLALVSKGISMPTGFHSGLNLVLASIGDKSWIPALWTVDFAKSPTEKMIQSNANFGLTLHIILLVILILTTKIYSNIRSKKAVSQ